jgi:hypothetical protein
MMSCVDERADSEDDCISDTQLSHPSFASADSDDESYAKKLARNTSASQHEAFTDNGLDSDDEAYPDKFARRANDSDDETYEAKARRKAMESDDEPYETKVTRKANESDNETYATKIIRRGNQVIVTVTSEGINGQQEAVEHAARLAKDCEKALLDKQKATRLKKKSEKKTAKADNPTKKESKSRVENTDSLLRRGARLVSSWFRPIPGGGCEHSKIRSPSISREMKHTQTMETDGECQSGTRGESGGTGRSTPYSSGPLPEKQSFHDEAHRSVNENMHIGNPVHQHVEISAVGEARRNLSFLGR